MKPIMNLDEVALEHHQHGERFECRHGSFSEAIGARLLGYSLCVVPPGKRAWPFHCHHVNEEMFVVLEGSGVVRIGDRELPIRAGDVIAAPPGGAATAHQIINNSDRELRYLGVSTKIPHEIVEYPDAGKVGVWAEDRTGPEPALSFHFRGRLGEGAAYWDGE